MINFVLSRNQIRNFVEYFTLFFIAVTVIIPFPSKLFYLVVFCAPLILVSIKKFRAVIVALCIGGQPLFSLASTTFGLSITVVVIGLIGIQIAMLLAYNQQFLLESWKKSALHYAFWIIATYTIVLTMFFVAPESNYGIYYIQYFFVYTTFSFFGGLLVVQSSMKLKEILLPAMLSFVCTFPTFNLLLLDVPERILYSTIGLRGEEGIDAISLGRLSGGLFVLAFCVLLEFLRDREGKQPYIQIMLASIISLPILWFIQTRQAIISVGLVILLSIFIFSRGRQLNKKKRLVILLSTAILIWMFYTFLNWAGKYSSQSRIHEDIGTNPRIYEWASALEGIVSNPIVGHGLGGYYSAHGIWPHNWVLEAWYDYGIIGLILFFLPIVILVRRFFSVHVRVYSWILLGVYWVIVAQASADIPRNSTLFFFFTIAFFSDFCRTRLEYR